jgi:hypothetical protein
MRAIAQPGLMDSASDFKPEGYGLEFRKECFAGLAACCGHRPEKLVSSRRRAQRLACQARAFLRLRALALQRGRAWYGRNHDNLAEWSKAVDSSSIIFGCVGSNPTVVTFAPSTLNASSLASAPPLASSPAMGANTTTSAALCSLSGLPFLAARPARSTGPR